MASFLNSSIRLKKGEDFLSTFFYFLFLVRPPADHASLDFLLYTSYFISTSHSGFIFCVHCLPLRVVPSCHPWLGRFTYTCIIQKYKATLLRFLDRLLYLASALYSLPSLHNFLPGALDLALRPLSVCRNSFLCPSFLPCARGRYF